MQNDNLRQIIVGHGNTFHDPAIAICEGNTIFAEGIERHTQCKRAIENTRLWYSWRAINRALSDIGILPLKNAEITNISTWDYDKLKYIAGLIWGEENNSNFPGLDSPTKFPTFSMLLHSLSQEPIFLTQLDWILRSRPVHVGALPHVTCPDFFSDEDKISSKSETLEHHIAHAANAVYTSPFEECCVMVIDGYGEETHTSFYLFQNNKFNLIHKQMEGYFSLGNLYFSLTELCGFKPWDGEEWKVMGLAAFGEFRPDIYKFFRDRIIIDGISFKINLTVKDVMTELSPMVGGFRHPNDMDVMRSADLAHNFQKSFEDTIIDLARNFGKLGISKKLAYSGGCALNSSANGKILENTDFENLHVPSAPADDGNALGAVLYKKYLTMGEKREPKVMTPYLGSSISIQELEKILNFNSIDFWKVSDEDKLCKETAKLLSSQKIIGWVQGRAEFGPRALGNRSIIADPRSSDMKDRINNLIKFREFYRPLAPSILHEFGNEYFENYQESPYMERTLLFKPDVRNKVPAVVHKDGTGRLQTVKKEWNPLYYNLIFCFYEKTKIPLILNTSFNVMGKPIIHSVEDAITLFYTTGMDYLIIGNYILSKR
ncbi:MAG: nodulation protein nolNO [Desulfobacterales bacterium]|nr:nodulation protein nolNO [Desulfobacterales bacterium]